MPSSSRTLESLPVISFSRVSFRLRPGLGISFPVLADMMRSSQSRMHCSMSRRFSTVSFAEGVTSEIPIEKPWSVIQRADSFASRVMHRPATTGEYSRIITCQMQFLFPPSVDLSSVPHSNSLFWKQTTKNNNNK